MEEEMQMILQEGGIKDDGMKTDPVSGNDVPIGSLAKEVRDDIPAQLSEGEYVVPADVVRFYGVKFFEDLRTEAKLGLQEMEKNGRIGGEPVEPQQQMAQNSGQGITEADLEALNSMMSTGAYEGGLMDKIAYTAKNDPMVNKQINKKGMQVNFAEGGQVSSLFGDPNEIDGIIDQVSIMAQQNPAIMQELAQRGIAVGQSPAQVAPQQMQQRNSPAQITNPVSQQMANGGTPDPFEIYRTPGASSSLGLPPPLSTVPDVTDTSTPATTVQGPAAPAMAPRGTPDVGQCGQGSRWNGFSCVDDSEGPDGDGDGGGGGSTKFWEGEDLSDISSYVTKELENVTPKTINTREAWNPVKGIFEMSTVGMLVTTVPKLASISKARAALEIGKDAGKITEEEYNELEAEIERVTVAAGLVDEVTKFARGTMRFNSGNRQADVDGDKTTTKQEWNDWIESLTKDKDDTSTVVTPEAGGAPPPPAVVQTNPDNRVDTGGGGDYSRDIQEQRERESITTGKTVAEVTRQNQAAEQRRGAGAVEKAKQEASEKKGGRADTSSSRGYTGSPGGRAKGGLMKKQKKK